MFSLDIPLLFAEEIQISRMQRVTLFFLSSLHISDWNVEVRSRSFQAYKFIFD